MRRIPSRIGNVPFALIALSIAQILRMNYTHKSEMTAMADSQKALTRAIVGYVLSHVRKWTYLPLIASG